MSSFFLETTWYVLPFPFLVTQFSVLLHPVFSHIHTNSSTNPPLSAKTWGYWPQWRMRPTTNIHLAWPVCWKQCFLSFLWLPFSYVSMANSSFKTHSFIVPQTLIYGYTLDQPNPCIGSNLSYHCYRPGPACSLPDRTPSTALCRLLLPLSSLCACACMCISYTLPYGSICHSPM